MDSASCARSAPDTRPWDWSSVTMYWPELPQSVGGHSCDGSPVWWVPRPYERIADFSTPTTSSYDDAPVQERNFSSVSTLDRPAWFACSVQEPRASTLGAPATSSLVSMPWAN